MKEQPLPLRRNGIIEERSLKMSILWSQWCILSSSWEALRRNNGREEFGYDAQLLAVAPARRYAGVPSLLPQGTSLLSLEESPDKVTCPPSVSWGCLFGIIRPCWSLLDGLRMIYIERTTFLTCTDKMSELFWREREEKNWDVGKQGWENKQSQADREDASGSSSHFFGGPY